MRADPFRISVPPPDQAALESTLAAFLNAQYIAAIAADHDLPTDRFGRRYVRIGDMRIVLPDDMDLYALKDRTWTGGIVPYRFDSQVTEENREAFRAATRLWSLRARVTFTELQDKPDTGNFVTVKNSSKHNSADVGMVGTAAKPEQEIEIYNWKTPIIIAHEIGHCLGLIHEQSRQDRDTYVTYIKENVETYTEDGVQKDYTHNFVKVSSSYPLAGDPYDFASITHYRLNAFAKEEGKNPLVVNDPFKDFEYLCGQRRFMSFRDGRAVAHVYGSAGFRDVIRVDTRQWTKDRLAEDFGGLRDESGGAIVVDVAVEGKATVKKVAFSIVSKQPGDCDLYVRRKAILKESDWSDDMILATPLKGGSDARATSGSSNEKVTMDNTKQEGAVRYQCMLHAAKAFTDLTLSVSIVRA
jgi:hypothetical protein